MALKQVEMSVVNEGGTSDAIVPNAIANNDGTSSGFSQDANNVLKVDDTEIVSKKILIGSSEVISAGDTSATITFNGSTVGQNIVNGGKYEAVVTITGNGYTQDVSMVGYASFYNDDVDIGFNGAVGRFGYVFLSTSEIILLSMYGFADVNDYDITFRMSTSQLGADRTWSAVTFVNIVTIKLYEIIE